MAETPEAQARQDIDEQLARCGWRVQDRYQADINAETELARVLTDFRKLC